MARIGQVAIVPRQVLEPRIRGLDEDLRLVAGIAQHALDAQHFVTDGVAVAKGREHLMDGGTRPACAASAAARRRGRRPRADAAPDRRLTSAPRAAAGDRPGGARPRSAGLARSLAAASGRIGAAGPCSSTCAARAGDSAARARSAAASRRGGRLRAATPSRDGPAGKLLDDCRRPAAAPRAAARTTRAGFHRSRAAVPSTAAAACRRTSSRSPATRSGARRSARPLRPSAPAGSAWYRSRASSRRTRRSSRRTARRCCAGTGPAARRIRVGEHGLAHRPRFERHHRQALEIRRHDQQFRGGHRVVLVLVLEEAEVMNARMFGNRDVRRADQHEVHAVDERRAVVLEEFEQLDAALVLVDAADVDREAIAHVELLAEARRRSTAREFPSRRRRPRRAPSGCSTTV